MGRAYGMGNSKGGETIVIVAPLNGPGLRERGLFPDHAPTGVTNGMPVYSMQGTVPYKSSPLYTNKQAA